MKKFERRSKDERRRVLLNNYHELSTSLDNEKLPERGSSIALVNAAMMVRNVNRRVIALVLAIVFVLTTLVVGINIRTKAVAGDTVMVDDSYTVDNVTLATYDTFAATETDPIGWGAHYYKKAASPMIIAATVSYTVANGKFTSFTITPSPSSISKDQQKYLYDSEYNQVKNEAKAYNTEGHSTNVANQVYAAVTWMNNQLVANNETAIIGKNATYNTIANVLTGTSYAEQTYRVAAYETLKAAILESVTDAPKAPNPISAPDIVDPYVPEIPQSAEAYLELNKTISPSANGNAYDLTLDAYSTANIQSYSIKEKKPTDYVIVIDQSGSMAHEDMPTGYKAAGNLTLEQIAEESLKGTGAKQYYYNDGENTYRVFADRGYLYEYIPANSKWTKNVVEDSGAGLRWFQGETTSDPEIQNQYYYQTDDGVFRPVTVTITGEPLTYYIRLKYVDNNGNEQYLLRPSKPIYKRLGWSDSAQYTENSFGYDAVNWAVVSAYPQTEAYVYSTFAGITTGMFINHDLYNRHVGYTRLLYRDKNGDIQVVPTKDGVEQTEYCDSDGNALTTKEGPTNMVYSGLLEGKDYVSRLSSLNTALQYFAQTLQHDIDSFGIVDNRVAIAGFSSENSTYYNYDNTELLTGVTLHNGANESNSTNRLFPQGHNVNGPQYYENNGDYGDISSNYGSALIDATVTNQDGSYSINPDFLTSIEALTAYGGTQPEDGLVMAKNIYDARTEDERMYTWRSGEKKGQSEERNKVVIFFTDGQPGNYSNSNQYLEANEVVEAAYDLKHYTNPGDSEEIPASIFSIGVFGVSDGDPLTYEAHDVSTPKADYEYESGYFYKYDTTSTSWWLWWETTNTNTHYLNRYWHTGEVEEYGNTPSDTIYDYMSVVSSQYPNATKFISDSWRDKLTDDNTPANHSDEGKYSNWSQMVDYVRGDKDPNKNYYRLAANPESLVDAFVHAATAVESEENQEAGSISEDTILKDVIDTSNFKVTDNTTVEIQVIPSTKQSNDSDIVEGSPIVVDTDDENESIDYHWIVDGNNQKTGLVVSGFDYNLHHIAHTNNDNGQKIRVIIKGVVPKDDVTGTNLTSNTDASGIYSDDTVEADMLKEFPIPAIARQKYTLNVGADDNAGVFDLNYILEPNTGVTADFNNILVNSGTARELYSTTGVLPNRNDKGNTDTVYLEYITEQGKNGTVIPADYHLTVNVAPNTSAYTYYLSDDHFLTTESEQIPANQLGNPSTVSTLSTTENGNLYITSIANTHSATLTLETKGEFANKEREFPIGMTIKNADGSNYNGDINLSNGKVLHFTDGVLTNTNDLKLKDSDEVTFTDLPAGSSVTITPSDDPGNVYTWTAQLDEGTEDASAKTGVIDQDGHVFHVVYTRGEVTDTGVLGDNSTTSILLYALAGMAVVSGGAGVAYVYRKKTNE